MEAQRRLRQAAEQPGDDEEDDDLVPVEYRRPDATTDRHQRPAGLRQLERRVDVARRRTQVHRRRPLAEPFAFGRLPADCHLVLARQERDRQLALLRAQRHAAAIDADVGHAGIRWQRDAVPRALRAAVSKGQRRVRRSFADHGPLRDRVNREAAALDGLRPGHRDLQFLTRPRHKLEHPVALVHGGGQHRRKALEMPSATAD